MNTVANIAEKVTQFRLLYSPGEDGFKTVKSGKKYYRRMINAGQLEIVLATPNKEKVMNIMATCEVWFIQEKTIGLLEKMNQAGLTVKKKHITDVSTGDIAYIANITFDPAAPRFDTIAYFKFLLKRKYLICDKCCWFNRKRNRMTKIFTVQRPWKAEYVKQYKI